MLSLALCEPVSLLQALRRFENMGSIKINGAASVADLAMLAVELEQDAGAWRVSLSLACYCLHCNLLCMSWMVQQQQQQQQQQQLLKKRVTNSPDRA